MDSTILETLLEDQNEDHEKHESRSLHTQSL